MNNKLNVTLFILFFSLLLACLMPMDTYLVSTVATNFLFSVILLSSFYLIFVQSFTRLRSPNLENGSSEKTFRDGKLSFILFLILSVVIVNVIVLYRFLQDPNPQGFDTAFYVYCLRQIFSGNIAYLTNVPHPLILAIFAPVSFVLGGSPTQLGFALPFVAGSIFVCLVFFAFYMLKRNSLYAGLIAVFACSNFFFIRLSYDLFSQLIFLGVFYLSLAFFIKGIRQDSQIRANKSYKIMFIITLLFMLFIDPTVSFIIYGFYGLVIVLSCNKGVAKNYGFVGKLWFYLLLVSGGVVVFIILYAVGYVDSLVKLYSVILGSELAPFRLPASWNWIIFNETLPMLFLAAFSCLFFIVKPKIFLKDNVLYLLLFWSGLIFSLIFLTGYLGSYRFFLLLPFSILAAHGVYYLLISGDANIKKIFPKKTNYLVSLGLIVVVVSSIFSVAYLPSYSYYPVDMQAIPEINALYEFNEPSVRILVNQPGAFSSFWYEAYFGSNVFIGPTTRILDENATSYTIITHTDFSQLVGLNALLAQRVSGNVYKINATYLSMSELELYQRWESKTNITYQALDFSNINYQGELNITNIEGVTIMFNDTASGVVGSIEQELPKSIPADECFAVFDGNLSQPIMIELINSDQVVASFRLDAIPGKNFGLEHFGNYTFDSLRISFIGGQTYNLQIFSLRMLSFGVLECQDNSNV